VTNRICLQVSPGVIIAYGGWSGKVVAWRLVSLI